MHAMLRSNTLLSYFNKIFCYIRLALEKVDEVNLIKISIGAHLKREA